MLSSKNNRIIKIFLSLIIFILLISIVNFSVVPSSYNHWFKNDWKNCSKDIDTVFIGDSLTLRSAQPSIADEKLSVNSFNISSASQNLKCSYFYLNEVIRNTKLKTVFLGLDYYNFTQESEDCSIAAASIIFDRLNLVSKFRFAFHTVELKDMYPFIFRFHMFKDSFTDFPKTISEKFSKEYREYGILNPDDYCTDKGYAYSSETSNTLDIDYHDLSRLSEVNIDYLEKIIKLCVDNNIEIIVIQTPYSKERFSAFIDYKNYYDTVSSLTEKYNVPFWDFNFCTLRDDIDDSVCFKDQAHLNYSGSCIFMQWLCDAYLQKNTSDISLFDYSAIDR